MNIDYEDIQSFKKLSLPEILKSYGILLKLKGPNSFMALCPFHDDKEPSLSVSQKEDVWLWHCFGCRKGGTVIDFVRQKENLSVKEVYEKLKGKIASGASRPRNDTEHANGNGSHKPNPLELLKSVTDFYHKTFFEDKRGIEYLRGRGLRSEELYRSFKIGFVNGSMRKNLSYTSPLMKDLKEIGILNNEGNEFFYNSVVIPLLDEDGNIVSLYGRNISQKRHLYLKGPHKGLVNRQGAYGTDKVILTEAVLDALSLYELGVRNVIPCYGTGGFTEDHKALLAKQRIKEVEFCFDNDDAGARGARDLGRKYLPAVTSSLLKLPEGIKDANDFLVSKRRKEDFETLERIPIEVPKILFNETVYEIEKQKDAVLFKTKDRSYRVLLPEYESIHSLRVNMKLEVGGSYHIDVVDLYSERQRHAYTKKTAARFSLPEEVVERDLYRILEELERQTPKPDEEKSEAPMSAEEKEEALCSLKNPSFTQEIITDLEKIGCVGEEQNKLLGYLVTISRRLPDTLSLTIVSQSGAGKSNLADTLEAILPKEEVVRLSRITPQALYYMEKTALRRKVLVIEEKEGSRDSDYSIRVLQSKKSLRLAVALKDPKDGRMKTQVFEVEGPVVVIETTTKTDINPENASRVFIAYLDETEAQTKKIHAFQSFQKTLEGKSQRKTAGTLIRKHQNIQRLLKEVTVAIPYVGKIHFPSRWMRTRRDYQKFLNLIEAVTFLHQYQRKASLLEDGTEYIESTIEDYRIAHTLACDIFGDCLSELMKPDRDFLERLRAMVKDNPDRLFERRTVRDFTGLPDHVVRERLRVLSEMEYLLVLEGKQGKQYQYKLNPEPIQSKDIIAGLTTPEELERTLKPLRGNFESKLTPSLVTS